MFDIEEYLAQKSGGDAPIRGLTPSFQVIFYSICLFNRNEDVTKSN